MKTENHSLLISIDSLLEEKMRILHGENILFDFEVAELLQISTHDLITHLTQKNLFCHRLHRLHR